MSTNAKKKLARRAKIKKAIRGRLSGTSLRPRLTVFRSNSEIYAQIIDDTLSTTLVSASSIEKEGKIVGKSKTEIAELVGKRIADKAKAANITMVVFDRNGYLYHGRVKALAEAARQNGLIF